MIYENDLRHGERVNKDVQKAELDMLWEDLPWSQGLQPPDWSKFTMDEMSRLREVFVKSIGYYRKIDHIIIGHQERSNE